MGGDTGRGRYVFVTVGTTSFDGLINEVLGEPVLTTLAKNGYRTVVAQIGRGREETAQAAAAEKRGKVGVEYYRFKDSLAEDMRGADLVISHAGSGSVLEALNAGKKLIVVVNEGLMDNHQLELASQLGKMQHLLYCTCTTLHETLQDDSKLQALQPFLPADSSIFSTFLDQRMGFNAKR
eukprot:comp22053_c0_seq1/m.32062 comp22053_c0_seq1/g.32062  ORF comp22053_c0_seq1/g.32062 comp22053_c0_seq1/m.32062 type:complete len:180 (-) comp22053_c0_seq1:426-965(-)